MKSIEKMVLLSIYGRGRGFVFSSANFIDEFCDNNINKALSELTKSLDATFIIVLGSTEAILLATQHLSFKKPFLKKSALNISFVL